MQIWTSFSISLHRCRRCREKDAAAAAEVGVCYFGKVIGLEKILIASLSPPIAIAFLGIAWNCVDQKLRLELLSIQRETGTTARIGLRNHDITQPTVQHVWCSK